MSIDLIKPTYHHAHDKHLINTRVFDFYKHKKVKRIDICCNAIMTVFGLAVFVGMVALAIIMQTRYGLHTKMTPAYAIAGCLAFLGGLTAILAIKWMVESIEKRNDFYKVLNNSSRH